MLHLFLTFNFISLFFLTIFKKNSLIVRSLGLLSSGILFLISLGLFVCFDFKINAFQFKYVFFTNFSDISLGFKLIFGVDNLSLIFIMLTSLLIFLCIIYVLNEIKNQEIYFYILNLLALEFFLVLVFSSLDTLIFYFFFEATLIPMFFLTGVFGSRERKTWAIYLLIFYTICGSLPMLLSILYLFSFTNTFSLEIYTSEIYFGESIQKILWCFFGLSFFCKIPVFPLHIWLPEAHVEAPTIGSVVLAGLLLKLGVYGIIRFNLTLFPFGSLFFSPYIIVLCSLGVIFSSLSAVCQSDIKRVIAYSSIAHMNLIVIGLFSQSSLGISGAIFQSISHGFVSSGLFFLIGFLYSRYHSRSIQYYSGLAQLLPIYSIFFLFISLANISLPGTSAFVGELLIFLDSFIYNEFLTFIIICSVVICAVYSLWLTNRILFGNIGNFFYQTSDLNKFEFMIIFSLSFYILFFGLFPCSLLQLLTTNSWLITFNVFNTYII